MSHTSQTVGHDPGGPVDPAARSGDGPIPATYRFVLAIQTIDGQPLRQVPIEPDWAPAVETTVFDAIRRGALPPVSGLRHAAIEPIWDSGRGQPYVAAFRVVVPSDAGPVAAQIPRRFVAPQAREAGAMLVADGLLRQGEVFTYHVCAFPSVGPVRAAPAPFVIEELSEPLPLSDGCLREYAAASRPCGEAVADEMPVFIADRVLDEALALARRAGEVEVGGVLVGHLRHDRAVPEIFVDVTALIEAPHTAATARSVTFTAATWAAVDAALALRRRGEIRVGWVHYHPEAALPCHHCPPDKRERCGITTAFFSVDDVHLHRTCFSAAYFVALLISADARTGLTPSVYGWRHGGVMSRAYHVYRGRGDR